MKKKTLAVFIAPLFDTQPLGIEPLRLAPEAQNKTTRR